MYVIQNFNFLCVLPQVIIIFRKYKIETTYFFILFNLQLRIILLEKNLTIKKNVYCSSYSSINLLLKELKV